MKINNFGENVYSQEDLIDILKKDPDQSISGAVVDFDYQDLLELGLDFQKTQDSSMTCQEWDQRNQSKIVMPEKYHSFDVAQHVLDLCQTDQQRQRVGQELLLFWDRGLFPLLQYLKYLVDTMRDNGVIWGLGRGSSVASYVLYLLGVHRVDSLLYELDIREFLR